MAKEDSRTLHFPSFPPMPLVLTSSYKNFTILFNFISGMGLVMIEAILINATLFFLFPKTLLCNACQWWCYLL